MGGPPLRPAGRDLQLQMKGQRCPLSPQLPTWSLGPQSLLGNRVVPFRSLFRVLRPPGLGKGVPAGRAGMVGGPDRRVPLAGVPPRLSEPQCPRP